MCAWVFHHLLSNDGSNLSTVRVASVIICEAAYVDTCSHEQLGTPAERQTCGALSNKLILRACALTLSAPVT